MSAVRPLRVRDNPEMASKGLTELWNGAMAAKPSDWMLAGVVCGPREVDPAIHGSGWLACATGPNGQRLQGSGGSPHDALVALTVLLKRLEEE